MTLLLSSIVERTHDATQANVVANHPAVKPGLDLGLDIEIDMTVLVSNPENLLFMGEHGGAILIWSAPGVYDAHNFVLPEGRGEWARKACAAILDLMFEEYGARMVWAQTPVENVACRKLNRLLGFQSEGIAHRSMAPGLPAQDVEFFTLCR